MKGMRKRWKCLAVLALSLSLYMDGCSKKPNHNENVNNKERRFLSIGTAPPGGAFFVVGSAIADVVGAHTKVEEGWQVSTEATKGTQENILRLDKGEIDFALANAAISFFAIRGQRVWEKEYPIRSIMTLAPNVAFFITPMSSGIKTIQDLKGCRVVAGPAGAGFDHFIEPILIAHGIKYSDLRTLHDTQAGAVALIADGSAEAAFLGGAVPTASITQACATQDIYFIPFDKTAIDRLVEQYRFFEKTTIPAGTYKGHSEIFDALNVGSMILVTSAQVKEDTVYLFTKTLFENAAEVAERHPAGKAINPTNAIRDTGTPFHQGAIRFYKEIGIWPEERIN